MGLQVADYAVKLPLRVKCSSKKLGTDRSRTPTQRSVVKLSLFVAPLPSIFIVYPPLPKRTGGRSKSLESPPLRHTLLLQFHQSVVSIVRPPGVESITLPERDKLKISVTRHAPYRTSLLALIADTISGFPRGRYHLTIRRPRLNPYVESTPLP